MHFADGGTPSKRLRMEAKLANQLETISEQTQMPNPQSDTLCLQAVPLPALVEPDREVTGA